jgi:hypothetical protein
VSALSKIDGSNPASRKDGDACPSVRRLSVPSDRLSLVLSDTWWVNSDAGFDPNNTVPVPAGGFVHRVARTPHYDGVKRDAKEPAVIALFGIAPVQFELVDPSQAELAPSLTRCTDRRQGCCRPRAFTVPAV